MDEWFREIREGAERALWSRGVELARANRIELIDALPERARLRVRGESGSRSPEVTLYFDDAAWDCDCDDPDDPCEHVAAAAIAWRRAGREGLALEAPSTAAAPVVYALEGRGSELRLLRYAQGDDGASVPIRSTLRAIARGRVQGPDFTAEDADWEIDDLLGDRHSEPIPRGVVPALVRALRTRTLRYENRPVEVASDPLRAALRIEDAPGGFRLILRPAARGATRIAPGLVLRDDTLHATDEGSLDGRERERYGRGVFVPNDHAQILVGETLPDLEGRIRLERRSERLPAGATREAPTIVFTSEREGSALRVRADIVYGDPPRARLEGSPPALVSLGGALPLRDTEAETRLVRILGRDYGLPVGATVAVRDAEALRLAARLRECGERIHGRAHLEFFERPPLHFALGEVAAYGPRFESGDEGVSADAVVSAWERGEPSLLLDTGGVAPLPLDWLEQHGRILASFLESREPGAGASPPSVFAAADWARLCESAGEAPPADVVHLRERLRNLAAAPPETPPLPSDLRADLRDYQQRGVAWLARLREAGMGALLADDMGLGKTLQVLCALEGRSLVVAPTSVLGNWRAEAERFRPALRVCLYHGSGRALDPDADLTLTSYAILRRDRERLCGVTWETVVLDEAQAIKNSESQAARSARALSAHWRVSLTGTPVENRLEELWSQLHFLNPGHLGSLAGFRRRFARPVENGDEPAAAELRARIQPVVLRRRKSEVARELPPRSDLVLRIELDEDERAVYDALRLSLRRDVRERLDAGASLLSVLESLLRLRQVACHRDLVPGQEALRSSKVDALLEQLETVSAEGHKSLVFSQWTGLLDRIETPLREAGLDFLRLDGSTRDRAEVVSRFQDASGPPVFLISLRAGGTGLNLTAADHVFLVDPWWNPAVEEQAADRAHRIGQERPVFVHRLVAVDTVEERMLALKERKLAAAESALRGGDPGLGGGAPGLEAAELLALLD